MSMCHFEYLDTLDANKNLPLPQSQKFFFRHFRMAKSYTAFLLKKFLYVE